MSPDSALIERTQEVEQGYAITPTGLSFLRDLTRTEWARLGQTLRARTEGVRWALGDWLVYGGRSHRGWPWQGSGYKIAHELTGYSVQFLSCAYHCALAFPPDTRDAALVWSIYLRVAQQPEGLRAELLARVRAKRWTTRDLEDYLLLKRPPKPAPTPKQLHRWGWKRKKAKCPACGHVFHVKPHLVKGDDQADPTRPAPVAAPRPDPPSPAPPAAPGTARS